MRYLLLVKIVAKPRDALRKSPRAQRLVAHRAAPFFARRFSQRLPEVLQIGARRQKFSAWDVAKRTSRDLAEDSVDASIHLLQLCKRRQINSCQLLHNLSRSWSFERQSPE